MYEAENVHLVRNAYRCFAAGDTGTLMKLLAPDVAWRLPEMHGVPFAQTWQGREGVRKFLETLADSQDVVELEPKQLVAQGDTVIVLGHFVMRVKATGRLSRADWAHVWTVERDQVTQFREYVDTAAVVAAHAAPRIPAKADRVGREATGIERDIADADKRARSGTTRETVRNTPPAGDWNDVARSIEGDRDGNP